MTSPTQNSTSVPIAPLGIPTTPAGAPLSANFDGLPYELIEQVIFPALGSAQNVLALGQTCKRNHALFKSDVTWEGLFRQHFPRTAEQDPVQSGYFAHCKYLSSLTKKFRTEAGDLPKKVVFQKSDIARYMFDGNLLYTLENHQIKVWDLEKNECIKTYDCTDIIAGSGQSGDSAPCFAVDKGLVYLGFDNGKISIFNLAEETPPITFQAHTQRIQHLQVVNGQLYTYAPNAIIGWDLAKQENSLKYPCLGLSQFQIHKERLYTISHRLNTSTDKFEPIIEFWDLKTGERIQSINSPIDYVTDLLVQGNRLYLTSNKEGIYVLDAETGKLVEILKENIERPQWLSRMQIKGNCALMMKMNGGVMVLDIETKECLHTFGPSPTSRTYSNAMAWFHIVEDSLYLCSEAQGKLEAIDLS